MSKEEPCEQCGGFGEELVEFDSGDESIECHECHGTGVILTDKEHFDISLKRVANFQLSDYQEEEEEINPFYTEDENNENAESI